MNNLHVKTGDNVMIISGKDKGQTGKVLAVSPKEGKVIVEGRNMVTKHVKPRAQGQQGGDCHVAHKAVLLSAAVCLTAQSYSMAVIVLAPYTPDIRYGKYSFIVILL